MLVGRRLLAVALPISALFGPISCKVSARADALDWELPAQAQACAAPADVAAESTVRSPRAGRYELTVVAVDGSQAGHRARGRLWLTPTSASDRSPRTGERVPMSDTLESPLYGATDLAFDSVGAPITYDKATPAPQLSTDPIYPGVLVLIQN